MSQYDNIYHISPESSLELLSVNEMNWLIEQSEGEKHELLRRCVLAVLKSDYHIDNAKTMLSMHKDFDVRLSGQRRGIRFELINPPTQAFVDGEMILGMREHLSAVVRDLIYSPSLYDDAYNTRLPQGKKITDYIFKVLRNAETVSPGKKPNLVVCWGGHSISDNEYRYSKKVGYELGARGFDICTGCGAGVMKGPMKGATISHAKHRTKNPLYLGITEPGIIASEAPNPIVNHLVIMPDIEKRLEAFVRLSHAILIFPGGAGTAEELLYLIGLLLHPKNKGIPLSVILTGPASSKTYFERLDNFIKTTLGETASNVYDIVIDSPETVSKLVKASIQEVTQFRIQNNDSFHYNWRLVIEESWQIPFEATHKNMSELNLSKDQPIHELALNLRKAFSGIVAGNIKPNGIAAVEKNGPFILHGSQRISPVLNDLLTCFIDENRMTLDAQYYEPCFKLIESDVSV
jgi:predicted Rossmann-fold nucleotide-binding protein